MLTSIEVTGFRALKQFRMADLARVNLLVGKNNCGKTSVLEAISILAEPGSVAQLWGALARRGEMHESSDEDDLDISHLFFGHTAEPGVMLKIQGVNGGSPKTIEARILDRQSDRSGNLRGGVWDEVFRGGRAPSTRAGRGDPEEEGMLQRPLALNLKWRLSNKDETLNWPISQQGALSMRFAPEPPVPVREHSTAQPVTFITTEGVSRERVVSLFEKIVLTEEEETVLSALRTIEPTIERIATVGDRGRASRRGGFYVRANRKRVPIGSMGDGMWRLLGIVIALVRARGGMLLVDEIDTGLHYSVISDMWRLVTETAERLDVQVFATTHSRDCYEALASIAGRQGSLDLGGGPRVSLQRIERDQPHAIAFTEAEIREAAERGIEVR